MRLSRFVPSILFEFILHFVRNLRAGWLVLRHRLSLRSSFPLTLKFEQILPVSLSDSGTTAAQSGPTPSQDPDPEKTPTGSPVRRGVRSPEEFMKSFRSASALGFNLGGSTAAPRRIIFTDVPEWASISDILGLVHGGAVDRVFVQGAGSVAVQFCEEESCQKYIDTYTSGIRIEGAVIKVAKAPTTDKMIPSLTALINKGASRVVRAGNIPLSMSLQDVHQLVRNLHVEHILYNARPGCVSSLYLPAVKDTDWHNLAGICILVLLQHYPWPQVPRQNSGPRTMGAL